MTPIRQTSRRKKPAPQRVSLIGLGNWGTALALALKDAGIRPREFVVRRKLAIDSRFAASLGAKLATWVQAALDADVFWICTPDAAIVKVAAELAAALGAEPLRRKLVVFHSSGALPSTELAALRAVRASIASVHPLMTFPRRSSSGSSRKRPLAGVPFAIEGDSRACRTAAKLVRAMAGEPFPLTVESKPLYHAFGAFASPMLVAALTAAIETAVAAGFTRREARRRMHPMVERTIANFFNDDPEKSFSGPIARGDTATIASHLEALRGRPRLLAVYRELACFALDTLPAQNTMEIRRLLIGREE